MSNERTPNPALGLRSCADRVIDSFRTVQDPIVAFAENKR